MDHCVGVLRSVNANIYSIVHGTPSISRYILKLKLWLFNPGDKLIWARVEEKIFPTTPVWM